MASVVNSVSLGHSLSGTTRGVSITPAVGNLLVVTLACLNHTNTGATCTDNQGGTYHRVGVLTFTNGTNNRSVTVFVREALTSTTSSHSVQVNAIDVHDSAVIGVVEVSGMARVGSAAVRQFYTGGAASGVSAVMAFASAELAANLIVGSLASQDITTTPPAGFTEHYDTSDGVGLGSSMALETCSGSHDGSGGTDVSWGATKAHVTGVFAVELDTSPTVSLNKSSYASGESVMATWAGLTDAADKIALALQAAGVDTMIDWVYSNGTQSAPGAVTAAGSHSFSGPALPGQTIVARLLREAPPPTWQATGTFTFSNSGAASPIALPAHQAGDIIVCLFDSTGPNNYTTPAGWTAFGNPTAATADTGINGVRFLAFWKRATSSSETNPSVADVASDDAHHFGAFVIRGCASSGDPYDTYVTGIEEGQDGTVSIPGLTTTVANTFVVAIYAHSVDLNSSTEGGAATNASLASLTERIDYSDSAGSGGGFIVWSGVKATPGTVDPTTFTTTSASRKAFLTVAFKA